MFSLSSLSDEEFLELLKRSLNESEVDGIELPGWPPTSVQEEIHGASGEKALVAAFNFFKIIKEDADFCEIRFHRERKVLDFGSGYGRITRLFMKDVEPKNIYALEPHSGRVQLARKLNPQVNFINSNYSPPSLFKSDFFDYICAFSIFTHLSEELFIDWFYEYCRVLKPGGLVVFTIMPPGFFNNIEKLRQDESNNAKPSDVIRNLSSTISNTFIDLGKARELYEAGNFVFDGQLSKTKRLSRYGWSVISRAYIENKFNGMFNVVDFDLNPVGIDQGVVCLQKRYT